MQSFTTYIISMIVIFCVGLSSAMGEVCLCDGDVNADGAIDLSDILSIFQCQLGDCTGCVVSCDINCDGAVDEVDVPFDPNVRTGPWWCLFEGGSAAACCPITGACCDASQGVCTDDVTAGDCAASGLVWSEGMACAEVSCSPPPVGACCDFATGACQNNTLASNCTGADLIWSQGLTCAQVSCLAPPVGACCNLGNGLCSDAVVAADCAGASFIWSTGVVCADVPCSVPPQDPCPCDGDVDADGTVNLMDWLCIQNCKAGDCSCCISSCDINCDGVVDDADAGDDPITEISAWRCFFVGGASELCCSAEYAGRARAVGVPTLGESGMAALALILVAAGSLLALQRRRVTDRAGAHRF